MRAQDDLYRFADGGWLARTEIPADRSNYGSFAILDDQAQDEVRQLIVAASEQANRAPGSDAQKAGDYYLFDNTGSYRLMWLLTIALGILAALINMPINERRIVRPLATPA